MSAVQFTLPSVAHKKIKQALYLYPDVFYHYYDERQYQRAWRNVHEEKKGYLIVEKGQVNRTHWFRYTFEQIKGWLGFSNACQPEKVTMAAQKLAYYGYLNGYSQTEALNSINSWQNDYKPFESFIKQCQLKRSNLVSVNLQNDLIQFYQAHPQKLDALEPSFKDSPPLPHITPNYQFGATYAHYDDICAMAWSDVQDEPLIDKALQGLIDPQQSFIDHTYPDSIFRTKYIKERILYLTGVFKSLTPAAYNEPHINHANELLSLFQSQSSKNQPSASELPKVLTKLYKQAHSLLQFEPDLIKDHYQFFINLEISSAIQSDIKLNQSTHYQEAYRLIKASCDKQKTYDYLTSYFLKERGFATLDLDSDLIKAWGTYLYQQTISAASHNKSMRLYRAAQIQPELIDNDHLQLTIDASLSQKNHVLSCTLIERLFNTKPSVALDYVKNNSELQKRLTKGAPLSTALAQLMVKDAKSWSLFGNWGKQEKFQMAAELDPTIQHKDAAPYFFNQSIEQKNWQHAFKLLLQRRKSGLEDKELPESALQKLAQYYFDAGNRIYEEGKALKPDYAAAEIKYRHSLTMMEAAVKILNNEKNRAECDVHKRLLAMIIIDGDEKQNSVNFDRVTEALTLLRSITRTAEGIENDYLDATFIRVLAAHVKLLHQRCLGAGPDDYNEATDVHKKRAKPWLELLIQSSDQLIELYKKAGKDFNSERARVHFLMAECIDYFKCAGDAIPHYKEACELECNQPFYHLRYAEMISDSVPEQSIKIRDKGCELLQACEINAVHYKYWFDERWQKVEQRILKQDIPESATIEKSGFSFLPGFDFGFGFRG